MAVIIEIRDACTPTGIAGFNADLHRSGYVIELTLAIVSVKAIGIPDKVGLEEIQMAVEVVVADANAHPRLFHSVFAQSDSTHDSFFAEGAVMVIHKKQTGSGVAGHENIGPAVLVEVGDDNGHSVALERNIESS